MAIVHTHQNAASACAAARVPVPFAHGVVPCASYALPGTNALTMAAADALGEKGDIVLLANHGVFAIGESLDGAFAKIRDLELACAEFLASRSEEPLPARADMPWKPEWLSPIKLADGFSALLSTAPFTKEWARTGKPLKATLDDLAQLVGPKIPSASKLPAWRPDGEALFVPDLGLLVLGGDSEAIAMVAEKAARAAIAGTGIGGAKPIPTLEAHLMRFVYKRSYAKLAAKANPTLSSSAG
jgi:hypothetical protein